MEKLILIALILGCISMVKSDVLLVIGENISYDDDELAVMQFVDFSTNPPRECVSPKQSPVLKDSLFGTYIQPESGEGVGQIIVCTYRACQEYRTDGEWYDIEVDDEYVTKTFRPGTAMLDNSTWFVAGGDTDKTWTYTIDGGFEMTTYELKFETGSFCLASLGDGARTLQVAGYEAQNEAFLHDLDLGTYQETFGVPYPVQVDGFGACGLSDGTREVLVAGGNDQDFYPDGRDESFLYDLDGGYWRPGPHLPTQRAWGAGVSYNNGLLVVGGTIVETHYDVTIKQILWYDPDNEVFVEMEQQLKDPAMEPTIAFFVPEEFADCQ